MTGKALLAMTKVINPAMVSHPIFDGIKIRKSRKKEIVPRETYRRDEDKFRNILIKYLRESGCRVIRVEPSFRGDFSLGDLWVSCLRTRWAGWVEAKSNIGKLSPGQIDFQEICKLCGVRYIVARDLVDVYEIINR